MFHAVVVELAKAHARTYQLAIDDANTSIWVTLREPQNYVHSGQSLVPSEGRLNFQYGVHFVNLVVR